MKRGQIWISAVIYIGLGIIAITLLVGAGVPLINKMRDRNTFQQTKIVMQTIDKAVFDVAGEGPGSQRFLSPLEIKKGFLNIGSNEFSWEMETEAILQEPGPADQAPEVVEGNLKLLLVEDELVRDLYDAKIILSTYAENDIILYVDGAADGSLNSLNGKLSLAISNDGVNEIGKTIVNVDLV